MYRWYDVDSLTVSSPETSQIPQGAKACCIICISVAAVDPCLWDSIGHERRISRKPHFVEIHVR